MIRPNAAGLMTPYLAASTAAAQEPDLDVPYVSTPDEVLRPTNGELRDRRIAVEIEHNGVGYAFSARLGVGWIEASARRKQQRMELSARRQ